MNLSIERRIGFGRQADFLVLAASWFAFGSLFKTVQTPPSLFVSWVLITTALLVLSLDAIGYFDRYTPQPELSGVLSLLLALPFSAFAARWLVAWATKAPLMPYHEVLRSSVWVAMAFEMAQWVIFQVHRTVGRRWVLATCLMPDELEALRMQVSQCGSHSWIRIQPINVLEGEDSKLRGHETLVISRRAVHDLRNHPEFLMAHLRGQKIVDVNQLLKEFRCRLDLRNADAWSFLLGSLHQTFLIRLYFHVKAMLEPILALALLVLLSPVLIAIAVVIYVTSGRPILYRQERLGYRGERFLLFKFRTMAVTAETSGPQWARKDDPRVTPLGKWLRKTRLDELPQLLNVVRGDLSFVGPRPERPEFYRLLNEQIPLFSLRLLVRPGVTGWAQVMQGYAASVEECKTKLEYDLYYVQNMSPGLDLRAFVNTLALMLRGNSGQ
jgi:lipopolysaccharide/colanic/teichoic acid biosynthesis glycosyltransferase